MDETFSHGLLIDEIINSYKVSIFWYLKHGEDKLSCRPILILKMLFYKQNKQKLSPIFVFYLNTQ